MAASTSTTGSRSVKAPLPASAEPPQAAALHAELRSLIASSRRTVLGRLWREVQHKLADSKEDSGLFGPPFLHLIELRHKGNSQFLRVELVRLKLCLT